MDDIIKTKAALPRGARIRIRTPRVEPGDSPADGRDTRVTLVMKDGSEVGIPWTQSVKFWVDSRDGKCTAAIVCSNVELEADAIIGTELERLYAHVEMLERENQSLANKLQELRKDASREDDEP